MPSSYTTSLKLTLPATGELSGTWGTTVNTGITSLVDDSIAGTTNITVGGSDYTLTNTDGAANEARRMFITATGTPGAARNVIVPSVSKLYFVFNNTTGGFALTFKTAAGTGIAVPAGARMILYCNGTNVVDAINSITLASPLPTSSGGTGLSSFTANRVFYASSTSAIGSSANLTFNGTTLTAAAFSGPLNGTVGATTPAAGSFTTLSASSTVSGTGFSTYLASPPAIGGTAPAAGSFTTLGATGNVNLNGGTFVFNDAGADLDARFEGDTDANLLFLDASTDRVGIGTNSPGAKLNLIGAGSATAPTNISDIASAAVRIEGTRASTGFAGVSYIDSSGGGAALVFGRGSGFDTNIGFYTNPTSTTTSGAMTERMRLDASGNLGIGTTSPTSGVKLDVIGAGQFLSNASNVRGLTLAATAGYASNISIIRTGYAEWLIGSPNNSDSLHISVTNPLHATPSMTFTAAGNVGIGTASPGAKLDVVVSGSAQQIRLTSTGNAIFRTRWIDATTGFALESNNSAESAYYPVKLTGSVIRFGSGNGDDKVTLDANGNLGIGTASPSAKLHVYEPTAAATNVRVLANGGQQAALQLAGNGTTFGSTSFDVFQDGGSDAYVANRANASLRFWTNNTERMRITGTGNISAGAGAVATTATDGFLYVPTCAGTPTGTPTAITGMAPIVVNTTNNKLYFYSGGQWRDAGP